MIERLRYHYKVWVRRFILPPKQKYYCMCGEFIRERRRHPCPSCGSLNRQMGADSIDRMKFEDKAG